MPKQKTRKSAAKRFKVTKTGKLKRKKACASHIMTKKSSKRRRGLRQSQLVDTADVKRVKKMLPGA